MANPFTLCLGFICLVGLVMADVIIDISKILVLFEEFDSDNDYHLKHEEFFKFVTTAFEDAPEASLVDAWFEAVKKSIPGGSEGIYRPVIVCFCEAKTHSLKVEYTKSTIYHVQDSISALLPTADQGIDFDVFAQIIKKSFQDSRDESVLQLWFRILKASGTVDKDAVLQFLRNYPHYLNNKYTLRTVATKSLK